MLAINSFLSIALAWLTICILTFPSILLLFKFSIYNLGFCLELRLLNPRPKLGLELLNWLLKFFLCNPEVRLKKSTFTYIKSLNRYNLRHNNCVIFSIFVYFKYSFLCTRYNLFVHRKKSYQLLICKVAKNLPVLELLNHFIKSSTVAYKRVAYKKNLVYLYK